MVLLFSLLLSAPSWGQTDNKLIAEEITPLGETNAAALVSAVVSPALKAEAKEAAKDFGFEYLNIKTPEPIATAATYKATAIGRTYMVNNPFDMEDLSNPFNLPRMGGIRKELKKQQKDQDFEKFVNTLFEYKTAPKKTIINNKPPVVAPFWMLFSLLGILSFFTYLTVSYKTDIKKTLQAFASSTTAAQQFRDQKNIFTPYSLSSYSLFVLTMGHFAFVAGNLWSAAGEQETNWSVSPLLLSILGVAGVYALKHAQVKLLSIVFPFKQQLDYYNYIIANGNKVVGMALTPILFLLVYSPETVKFFSLYTALTILGVAYLYRYVRSAIAANDVILMNKVHFFIYLCSVEIVPVLILLKLLSII